MVNEYEIRRAKAEEIKEKLNDLVAGLLIVGSVAYNPEAVTSKSDLDLVGILDFSKVNFKKLYKRLNQDYEPLLVKHAQTGKINTVSVVWDTPDYEIGLHLWDENAFRRIIELEGYNNIFRREVFERNFKSTADIEVLKNLKGESKEIFKEPQEVEGGQVLRFYSFFEEDSNIYLGIQTCNLLFDPIVLIEQNNFVSDGIEIFNDNFKTKLKNCYNKSSKEINLNNALAPKLQGKISKELKDRLEQYF